LQNGIAAHQNRRNFAKHHLHVDGFQWSHGTTSALDHISDGRDRQHPA
jgi:hypothetical protein